MSEDGQDQDGSTGGDAPHEEGSQEQGEQGKGKNRIPMDRVKEMIGSAVNAVRAELGPAIAALKAENNALKESRKPAPQAPTYYTRAQLDAAVEAGQLTKEVADQVYENQIVDRARRAALETSTTVASERERTQVAETGIADYQRLVPDAWVDNTAERKAVAAEYRLLVQLRGKPATPADEKTYEFLALRAAFGDTETIKRSRSAGRGGPFDTHRETGGSGGGRTRGGEADDGDGPPKGMDERTRTHYEKAISTGAYPNGWKDVRAELKFAKEKRPH